MRWNKRKNAIQENSPFNYKKELLPDPRGRTTVLLWLFCGYTQKRAYEIGYSWNKAYGSLPVVSTNFFRTQAVELYVKALRDFYEIRPYINLKAYRY